MFTAVGEDHSHSSGIQAEFLVLAGDDGGGNGDDGDDDGNMAPGGNGHNVTVTVVFLGG